MKNPEIPKVEDIYELAPWIGDYSNETFAIGIDANNKIQRRGRMRSVEERYAGDAHKEEKDEIAYIPDKVKRINEIAEILNATDDVTIFKQARNELARLLYGKSYPYPFPEEAFNPDLLVISQG